MHMKNAIIYFYGFYLLSAQNLHYIERQTLHVK